MIVNDGGGSYTPSPISTRYGSGLVNNASRVTAAAPKKSKPIVRSLGTASAVKKKLRSNISSGGGSVARGTSSSGGGSSSGGIASGTPGAPTINSYLGTDSTYQQAVSGGKRSLNDFLSELTRRRGEATTQFGQTTASMEHDRVQQLEDLKNEFASRGLIQSGLYGSEQGKFQQKFTEQQTALQQQQAALLADLMSQETNYRRENDLSTQQAKQEALLRRAQKFNIGG